MEPEKKSHGALIGSIIIVLVLIIGGIYAWQQKEKGAPDTKISSDLNTLEQEIDSTNTDVDINLDEIE